MSYIYQIIFNLEEIAFESNYNSSGDHECLLNCIVIHPIAGQVISIKKRMLTSWWNKRKSQGHQRPWDTNSGDHECI